MPIRSVLRAAVFWLLLIATLLAVVAGPVHAVAKPKPKAADALPLHLGSVGPRVELLQRLLKGQKPNVFKGIKGTFPYAVNDLYGSRTGAAVYAYKYRLGYQAKDNVKSHPVAGADFFNLLEGKKKRTIEMVALAQIRIQAVEAGSTVLAQQIKRIENGQLGASETNGSNCGPIIDAYFHYFGIGCGLPWCEIFQQWAFAVAGIKPPFANRSFLVSYTASWAQSHGYLSAKAKVGSLVAFLDDGGHIGYIVKVLASGYVTDEGNSSNRVQQVFHPWNSRLRVFIDIPGVA